MSSKVAFKGYSECRCGAVTLWLVPTGTNSVKRHHLKNFGLSLEGIPELAESTTCNHCINNYGLDLCKCGSGVSPDKCCGVPCETLGKPVSFYEIVKNFIN